MSVGLAVGNCTLAQRYKHARKLPKPLWPGIHILDRLFFFILYCISSLERAVTGQLVIIIMSTSAARMLEPAHTNRLVTQILEQHLQAKEYDLQKSMEWSQEIADLVLDKLNTIHATPNGLHRYKYIVNCSIQKHGSGLQSSSACLWNTSTDVATCVRHEHRSIDCTVNVYAIAFD